jgi:hypothetical protein
MWKARGSAAVVALELLALRWSTLLPVLSRQYSDLGDPSLSASWHALLQQGLLMCLWLTDTLHHDRFRFP